MTESTARTPPRDTFEAHGARAIILASWRRCELQRVDPARPPLPPKLPPEAIATRLAAASALLHAARPHLQWLHTHFDDVRHVVYLADAHGFVLESYGDPVWREVFGLEPGYDWSESVMGTNGAGTALVERAPVAVVGAEHYVGSFADSTCVAAPIRDAVGRVVGAIDFTTSASDGSRERTRLISYVAAMIERDLQDARREADWRTTQRLAEQLVVREEEARQARDRLQLILDNAPVLIYVVDDAGRFLSVNRAWHSLSGLHERDFIGRSLTDVFPPATARQFEANNRRTLETGHALRFEEEHDGRTYLSVKVPVRDAVERAYAICGMSVDVTEQKRADAEREGLVARLQEVDRAKDAFMAMLAHELRNPLSAMAAAVALLESKDLAAVDWCRGVLDRQLRQLARIVNDLQDTARLSVGKLAIRTECVDLREAMAHAVEDTASQRRERGQSLTLVPAEEDLHVDADRARLEQIFSNLLTNAAKYTDRGGSIEVALLRDGDEALVCVADNGMGIAADVLPHLFEPFFQGQRAIERSEGGIGIGLALVKRLVALHGGRVSATSDGPGKGATFTVRLPLRTEMRAS